MARDADWTEPELPKRANSELLAEYLKDHPTNYAALQRQAKQLIAEKKFAEAKHASGNDAQAVPERRERRRASRLLARVHRELKETPQERAVLESLAKLNDDSVDLFARLAELSSQAGDWEATRQFAQRRLAVSPLQPAPHRIAAEAAEKLNDGPLAIDSYRALLLLNPVDVADLHLKLATAFSAAVTCRPQNATRCWPWKRLRDSEQHINGCWRSSRRASRRVTNRPYEVRNEDSRSQISNGHHLHRSGHCRHRRRPAQPVHAA